MNTLPLSCHHAAGRGRQHLRTLLSLSFSAWLVACGGGGGDPDPTPIVVKDSRAPEPMAYVAATGGAQHALFAVNDDGTGHRLLSLNLSSTAQVTDFAVSADRSKVAYRVQVNSSLRKLYVAPMSGTGSYEVVATGGSIGAYRWSPAGNRLAFDEERLAVQEVFLVDVSASGLPSTSRKVNGSTGSGSVLVRNPQWSPDGRYILQEVVAFRSPGGPKPYPFALNVHDTQSPTAANSRRLYGSDVRNYVYNAHWSSDSQRVAFTTRNEDSLLAQVYTVAVASGTAVQVSRQANVNTDSRWSPTRGDQLLFVDDAPDYLDAGKLVLSNGRDKASRTLFSGTRRPIREFEWSPGGSSVAVVADAVGDGFEDLHVVSIATAAATRIAAPAGRNASDVRWAPDSANLAFQAGRSGTFIANVSTTQSRAIGVPVSSLPQQVYAKDAQWSSDGQRVAYITSSNTALYTSPLNVDQPSRVNPGNVSRLYAWSFARR
jgi:Tol biopolymer transport system component